MNIKKSLLLLIVSISILFTGCFEDNDDNLSPVSTATINDFIWRGLNYYYLYKADNPSLANDAFPTTEAYEAFLNSYETPEDLFDFLQSPQDRFSILVSDYIQLENALSGVSLNNGMEFGLVRYPDNSGNVFGYVRYVIANSDAAANNVMRGMIFNTIDGTQLTEDNFGNLLAPETYSIGLATFDGTNITPTNESISLTKAQITENPVHTTRVLEVAGRRIGYLLYNGFTNEFDAQLNAAFGDFAAQSVTDVVLDLRYNSGGSVESAVDLSSMITGQFNGEVIYSEEWNEDRQGMAENGLFNNTISNGNTINSLNLSRVHIITTRRSASASELVINSLNPYINTVQVGDTTAGKFQASFLLYDAPAPGFSRSEANINHRYAMLPLVFKTLNIAGNTDYIDGLFPNIVLREDYSNLGQLGDANEPLLAAAIEDITGVPAPRPRRPVAYTKEIGDSKQHLPNYQIMYLEE